MDFLTGRENLTELNLNSTKITDAGLTELKGLRNLATLYLSGTSVTEAGLKELKQALPVCKVIR